VAKVLILARDEVVSALLGLLVELCGYRPVFVQKGETAADACARLGCSKVVIDCDHWECSRKTLGTIKDSGVRVLLFSASRIPSELMRATSNLGIDAFTLPIGPDAFGKLLA
jgi:DNA-binding NtrC family response regulator